MRASIEEYKAVEKAAMKFVQSVAEGNSSYAKELFIDEAVLFGFLDGELEHGSIEQFYRNVDTVGPDSGFKARIDVVDVEVHGLSTRPSAKACRHGLTWPSSVLPGHR